MNQMRNRIWVDGLAAAVLGMLTLGPALWAQDQGQGAGQPARAERLSYVDGQVTLAQGGQVLAEQAVANTPMLEGMQLTTADSGKAEIQFEDGSVARVSPDSSMTLQVLSGSGAASVTQMTLNGGLAYFEFQGGGQAGQISVTFGDAQLTTSGFTVVRVDMDNPPGAVAVFSGNVHLNAANGAVSVDLHGGESLTLNGANPANYQLAESIDPDSWDEWNSDRDQELTSEAASQSPASADLGETQNPAWNELDANGNWYDVPNQGYVWSPYEAASSAFDPYGYGNWMWTPGYGYLWISGYPWGYMPFQCGAWNFYDGFGWGWAPGLGGCRPWWGLGLYGGPNFGIIPPGYRVIPRPILPRHPIGSRPIAIIAVNRSPVIGGAPLPARNRNTPVTIGGSTVQPLRPVATRPIIEHAPVLARENRSQPASPEMLPSNRPVTPDRPGYSASRSAEPAQAPRYENSPAPSHDSTPRQPSYSGGSSSHVSGGGSSGGGPPHPSGGSSGGGGEPHSSGGGGGGGASHSSGGGGGGGGGGSHGGGGGGGRH